MSGRNAQKNKNTKIADEFKEICPESRRKDLDALVKKHKGNRDKIGSEIQTWWDAPAPVVEEEWNSVIKKVDKKSKSRSSRDSGRGGGGRGGFGRGDRGGRGGGRGGRGGGADRRRERDQKPKSSPTPAAAAASTSTDTAAPVKKEAPAPGPAPVKQQLPLQGAWGQRSAPVTSAPAAPVPASEAAVVVEPELELEKEELIDVGIVSAQDPMPSGLVEDPVIESVSPPSPKPAARSGNVWATRGSAHLIEKEKPKPFMPIISQIPTDASVQSQSSLQAPVVEEPIVESSEVDIPVVEPTILEESLIHTSASDALDDGLPASVNGANINAAGWKPNASDIDIGDTPLLDATVPVKEAIVAVEEVSTVPTVPSSVESSLKPVLNMGHWETGDGDEAQSLDFQFGSFGADNDVTSVDETTISSTNNTSVPVPAPAVPVPSASEAMPTVSPARPPPGLGIGMPPMPEQVLSVHELENKLGNVSLASKKEENVVPEKKESLPNDISTATTQTATATPATQPNGGFNPPGVMSQPYSANHYGMNMYNYQTQNSGFMGVPSPSGPVLSNGVLSQQTKQQNVPSQGASQQGSLYGTPAPAATENNANAESANPSNAAIPPGMHGMAQYNPVYYGQQPYQMGQPHAGVGYGYGYGAQFGGVQGFGYPSHLQQGGGYGQPYEDQSQQHHAGSHNGNSHQGGGYNNSKTGGYRGRNNHHNNQYQNPQYNPQGYGGQPYNMGYNNHPNQYGHAVNNMDPYMQSSGGYQSNFNQEDDQRNKGGKKGRSNFGGNNDPNVQQYQQGHQQVGNQTQQNFGGLPSTSVTESTAANNGLSYQNWGGSL